MILAQRESEPLVQFTLAPLFEESGIALAVMGILVVFLALLLVVVFISILPRLVERITPTSAPQPAPMSRVDEEISEETLAVIAAAVAVTLKRPHRVVRVRGMTPEDLGWSLEGRMHHHHQHVPRRAGR
jgi:sodium pump decarboxylase gamma subunit